MKMCGNQKEPFPRLPNAFTLLEIKPTNNEIHNITILGLSTTWEVWDFLPF
jgi:hypothetical protein